MGVGAVPAGICGKRAGEKDLLVLGIHGSPRGVNSRTRTLLQWVLAGAESAGAETDLVDLPALRIEACTGCESCSLTGTCVQSDDFSTIFYRMVAADGVVLGSPVYIDNVTGQMKVFIDRLADAIHYQTLSGKYGCAIATTWSSGGDEVVSYLNHVLTYLGILTLDGISVAIEDDPASLFSRKGRAHSLGQRLVGAIRTEERYPIQERIIAENRRFFAKIVEQNRDWRPGEFQEWVRKGWIS